MSGRKEFQSSLISGRAAQVGWLVFLLISLSLALPGLVPYRQMVQTACSAVPCLIGQLTAQEAVVASANGNSLDEYASLIFIIYLFTAAFLLVIAFLLIARKPAHPGSVCGSVLFIAAGVFPFVQASALAGYISPVLVQILRWNQFSLLLPALALIPDGRFHPAWVRWLALGLVPVAALATFGPENQPKQIMVASILSIAVIGSVLYRPLVEKQRQEAVTWTLVAAGLLVAVQLFGQPVQWLPLPHIAIRFDKGIGFTPYPIYGLLLLVSGLTCLAVALLGDELFRVDVALNRAIVYGFLSLFVISSYVLIVGYLSSIFQSGGNLWFSLVATGVIAALFQPIREWLQRFVNRMIYGERDDPYTVIYRLGQNLETVMAPDQVIPTILHTVCEALKVTYAAIRLPETMGKEQSFSAKDGKRSPVILSLPLTVQNQGIGYLDLGPRQGENAFSTSDRLLLEGLARQAGTAIHSAQLNADLQRARERLVLAQEEERRRIRRDLHDGLGASLAALNLQAGEVQRLLAHDPEAATRRLAELRNGLRAAVGDTRRLVYGLRPPALDDLGLLEALRSRIDQYQGESGGEALHIRLDAPETLPELPAAVEVAVYRIVEEALTNIVHHSQARNGTIALSIIDQAVCVKIRDDGVGLPETYQHGIGLNSMRERAAELGGSCSIQSAPGQGTQVSVVLPIFSSNDEESHDPNHHSDR